MNTNQDSFEVVGCQKDADGGSTVLQVFAYWYWFLISAFSSVTLISAGSVMLGLGVLMLLLVISELTSVYQGVYLGWE